MSSVISKGGYKLGDVLTESYYLLSRSGINNPRLEAELIASHFINVDRFRLLLLDNEYTIGKKEREEIIASIKKRCNREPIQYLLGEVEFYGYYFIARRGVFIPRPESELLVEEGLKIASNLKKSKGDMAIIDLCTGSGCVAIALAKEIPYSRIYATDVSPLSIEVSSENALRSGVLDRVESFKGDLFEPLERRLPAHSAVLIVSNPPYIPSADLDFLTPEVRDHEPRIALDGGKEGLGLIKRIIRESPRFLSKNGHLLLEIGIGQAAKVKDLIGPGRKGSFFKSIGFRSDYAGIERIAILHG